MFEESRFTVCDAGKGRIELVAAGPRRACSFAAWPSWRRALGARAERVAFAMNAGMYDEDGPPDRAGDRRGEAEARDQPAQGRRQLPPDAQRRVPGAHGRPRRDRHKREWKPSPDVRLATQSGPMLVIDGKLHPAFDHDGTSRHVRNGVGIGPQGRSACSSSATDRSRWESSRAFTATAEGPERPVLRRSGQRIVGPGERPPRRDQAARADGGCLQKAPATIRYAASAPGREGLARPEAPARFRARRGRGRSARPARRP